MNNATIAEEFVEDSISDMWAYTGTMYWIEEEYQDSSDNEDNPCFLLSKFHEFRIRWLQTPKFLSANEVPLKQ